ncbi:MAG TPA: riboflavin synthase [Holophaga sp.]|nr:riboflavin synthase [Holophaga sp.]
MFTGLIRHLGALEARPSRSQGGRLRITAPEAVLERAEPGASIAVNGACLTAVERDARSFTADLSEETLRRTTLGTLALGAVLHLEPALRLGEALDGHLVQGHVDAVGRLLARCEGEGAWRFEMPSDLAPLVAPKGSIAVDGISLTVVEAGATDFTVALIPETVKRTRLADLRPGEPVNLEVDVLARYVARIQAVGASGAALARFAQEGWA